MSLISRDYYDLGDPTNPVESIDMNGYTTGDTAAIELFRAKTERGFFPRYIAFFYTMSGLTKTGTGAVDATPRVGPAVGTPPALSGSGKLWYFPGADAADGGPDNDLGTWVDSETTEIDLHGDNTDASALASFLLGFPAADTAASFGECQPIQYPIAWLELTMANWDTGTMAWWARLIK
jgi:hypothetical protein